MKSSGSYLTIAGELHPLDGGAYGDKPFVPSIAAEHVAQLLYFDHGDAESLIGDYCGRLKEYYCVKDNKQPNNAGGSERVIVRHLIRTVGAPLLFKIEQQLTENMAEMTTDDERINTELLDTSPGHVDRIVRNGRKATTYTNAQQDFLRATGRLAHRAAAQVLSKAANDKDSHEARLFTQFKRWDNHSLHLNLNTFRNDFKPRQNARERLIENVISVGFTVLNMLEPAYKHGVHEQTEQLSWAASTSTAFFERYFDEAAGRGENEKCPFTPDSQDTNDANIWHVQSLRDGPWTVRRFCPENIPFYETPYSAHATTGALLRLHSIMPVARQLLWGQENPLIGRIPEAAL